MKADSKTKIDVKEKDGPIIDSERAASLFKFRKILI